MIFFIIFPILFLFDYIITYIGIQSNVICEANPLIIWMFNLPFLYGLIVRVLIGTVFTCTLWVGRNTKIFKIGYKVIIACNSIVFMMHLEWIIIYMLYK